MYNALCPWFIEISYTNVTLSCRRLFTSYEILLLVDITANVAVYLKWNTIFRDVTKFAFEFDNVRTSNVISRFEIRRIFSFTHRRIRTSGLHDRHYMSTPTGHRNNQLNKCALPNSLKGLKIILDTADHHVSKDGPFRILGNALTCLLSDFFGNTHFLS